MAAGTPAVVADELIEERRRLGLDRRDEMWDGVLHMVPPASSAHGRLEATLVALIAPIAAGCGLLLLAEPGVFDPAAAGMTSYRVPDLGLARPEHVSERGIEGRTALVVEVLSPRDEAHEKLPFYLRVGVEELLYVASSTKAFEVRRSEGDRWRLIAPGDDGWTPLQSLDVAIRLSDDVLQVRTDARIEEI
jgi:Uma2 family endonuclease